MILENVDRRVLGAFRCVDAVSKAHILEPMTVQSKQLDLRQNASNIWVVFDASGMHDLTTQFDVTSPWPAPTSWEVSIRSSSRRYLARRADLKMPRKLAPTSDPDSVMVAQDVVMYPAPTASPLPNWALVRASVTRIGTTVGLPWAVLRVTRDSDQAELATGMSNENGDALLAIPGLGIAASQNGGGAVSEPTIDATVTAFWDPSISTQPKPWVPNPDLILNDLANATWKKFSAREDRSRHAEQSQVADPFLRRSRARVLSTWSLR